MAARREQVVQAAEKLVARGKIEAAIREYRKVLTDNPNDAATLNRVGDLYARIERYDEAVPFFAQIAENYAGDGFFVKAIAIFKKIIKLDPTRLEVYERLAELYHRQGLVNEARTQYQVLADYYLKHENKASALSIYERMAELEPDNPSPRVKLAELYRQQRLTDKAMGEYRSIAEMMIAHGHADEAAQVYERALDVSSSDLEFIGDAVSELRRAGHDPAAARLLAAATRRNPEARKLARMPAPSEAMEAEPEAAAVEAAHVELPVRPEPPPPAPRRIVPPPPEARRPEPPPEPAAAADEEIVLELDLDADELEVAAPPESVPFALGEDLEAPVVTSPADHGEIELDLGEVFSFDLDSDETPASLVTPPPDMLDAGPAAAGLAETAETIEPPPEVPGVEPLLALDEVLFEWDQEVVAEMEAAEAAEAAAVPGFEPAPEEAAAAAPELEIDTDFLEKTAAELLPKPARNEDDLYTEAEVLAKYSLEDKAAERLQEVLRLNPRHLDAMALLIRIDVDKERFTRAAATAGEMAKVARARGDLDTWRRIKGRLEAVGFGFEGDRVVTVPEPVPDRGEVRIGKLIQDLLDEPKPKPKPRRPGRISDTARLDAAIAEIASTVLEPGRRRRPAAPPAPPPPPPAPPAADAFEDSGVGWLDEVAPAAAGPAASPAGEEVFAEEEQFFDLAAELEHELELDEAGQTDLAGDVLPATHEQSLEEIVEGFKRGVAESLSPEDYDTHFNLGIAYREMGLLDEAIGEFQLAAKAPGRLVECCSMLGLCFLDKGLPELSIKWYKRGLAAPDLTEDDTLGLLYDLGNVHLAVGDLHSAYSTFVEVYGTNSNYRDVVAKLEEISSRSR